jgi:hypothetical protein
LIHHSDIIDSFIYKLTNSIKRLMKKGIKYFFKFI